MNSSLFSRFELKNTKFNTLTTQETKQITQGIISHLLDSLFINLVPFDEIIQVNSQEKDLSVQSIPKLNNTVALNMKEQAHPLEIIKETLLDNKLQQKNPQKWNKLQTETFDLQKQLQEQKQFFEDNSIVVNPYLQQPPLLNINNYAKEKSKSLFSMFSSSDHSFVYRSVNHKVKHVLDCFPKVQIYHVPKQQIDIYEDTQGLTLKNQQAKESALKAGYTIKHFQIHQQHIGNLCGFHMTHALLEIARFVVTSDKTHLYNIIQASKFWQFHYKVTSFLNKYAQKNYDQSKYPWTEDMCLFGDYERIYNTLLTNHHPYYHQSLLSRKDTQVQIACLEFQFGSFVTSFDDLKVLQMRIDEFRLAKVSDNQRNTFLFQLGCTNHWVGFAVIKMKLPKDFNKQQASQQEFQQLNQKGEDYYEFIYIDSKNQKYLGWNYRQIQQHIAKRNEERVLMGKERWSNFYINCHEQCIKDVNALTGMLARCFMGDEQIYDYIFKTKFKETHEGLIKPCILDPIVQTIGDTALGHSILVQNIGDLKTYVSQFMHLSDELDYLSPANREELYQYYLNAREILEPVIYQLKVYRKGKQVIAIWMQAAKNFQHYVSYKQKQYYSLLKQNNNHQEINELE